MQSLRAWRADQKFQDVHPEWGRGRVAQMIRGSVSLPLLLLVDMAALLLYNFSGMCVTGAQTPSGLRGLRLFPG